MLKIKDLKARVAGGPAILDGITLDVPAGELHAIMGPNGSGKSTLSRIIAGHPDYEVTGGSIAFEGVSGPCDLLTLAAHERACEGVFMAFQYPVEVPGVSNAIFLRAAYNAVARYRHQPELDPLDFEALLRERVEFLGMSDRFIERPVNVDFSGGEKKRNEVLQMAILKPRLAVLDETDSGLDVDSLKAVADGVNRLREPAQAVVVITHYQRLLHYLKPDVVHILGRGRILRSGDHTLADEVERRGYDWVLA